MAARASQLPTCDGMDSSQHAPGEVPDCRFPGNALFPSIFLVLLCIVFSYLGMVCSFTRFNTSVFCDLDNLNCASVAPINGGVKGDQEFWQWTHTSSQSSQISGTCAFDYGNPVRRLCQQLCLKINYVVFR